MDEAAVINRAKELLNEKQFNTGAAFCEEYLGVYPDSNLLLQYGVLLNRDSGDYDRATELASQGTEKYPTSGWYWKELANCLYNLEEYDEARDAIEYAQIYAPEEKFTWIYGLRIYEALKDYENQIEALIELNEFEGLDATNLEKLGRAYHNSGEYYDALRFYRQSIALGNRSLALSNIGAVYMTDEISQDADAADAFRRVLDRGESEFARKRFNQTRGKLLPLAERAEAEFFDLKWKREKYKHYCSPFEIFEIDVDLPEEKFVKKVSKLRKTFLLLADEDGGFYEYGGKEFSKDEISQLAEELKDPERREYHYVIDENLIFHNFLRKGDIKHFLYDDDYDPRETLEYLDENPRFREFLLEPFSQQYSSLLCAVIDQYFKGMHELIGYRQSGITSVLALLEVLFDGRRWVDERQEEDLCFHRAHDRVEEGMRTFDKLNKQLSSEKIKSSTYIELVTKTRIVEFINLVPRYFSDLQQDFVRKMRNLAVDMANNHADHDASMAILNFCKKLQFRDQHLMEQVSKDIETVEGLIAQEKEHEIHFTIGNKPLKITREYFLFDKAKMLLEDIHGVKIGQTVDQATGTLAFMISVRSGSDVIVAQSYSMLRGAGEAKIQKMLELNRDQLMACANYIVPKIAEKLMDAQEKGQRIAIGRVALQRSAIHFERKKFFKTKQYAIPLRNADFSINESVVTIRDRSGHAPDVILDTRFDENSIVLPFLDYIK